MGFEIDFLPVGDASKSGDAITLRYGNLFGARAEQTVVVVDGGFKDTGDAVARHVNDYYRTAHIDLVVSTHPDDDHIRGLITLFERDDVTVGQLWLHRPWEHNENARIVKSYARRETAAEGSFEAYIANAERLNALAEANGVPVVEPFTWQAMKGDGYTLAVVGPDRDYYRDLVGEFGKAAAAKSPTVFEKALTEVLSWADETLFIEALTDGGTTSPANNSTVSLLLTDGQRHSLLTGDAGMPALDRVANTLAEVGIGPSSLRFVQVPHHGSRHNVGPTILNRLLGQKGSEVARGTAFCSAAADGEPRHPAKMVLNAFRRRGYPVGTTCGNAICFREGAPDRPGWGPLELEPFHGKVETFED